MTENQPTSNSLVPQHKIRYFSITSENGLELHSDAAAALQATEQEGYVWFDYYEPDPTQLEELTKHFQIHPLSIEDSLTEDQLPKLDHYPTYSFMIFNYYEETESKLLTHELNLMLGKNFLVTISHLNNMGTPTLTEIDKSVEREINKVKQGPSFMAHLVIDIVVDRKFQTIDAIETKLENSEILILDGTGDFDLSSLLDTRHDLMTIRRSLFYEREVINKLLREDSPFVAEKSLVYYRDIYDHLSKYYEISENSRDQVTNLMQIYLSMTSNRMAEISNRTNRIMRRLTLITTIFMPLSLIAGIGGMSEFTLLAGKNNPWLAYLVLFIVMVLIGLLNYFFLKRMEQDLNVEE